MVNQIEDDNKTLYTNDENPDLSTVTQKKTHKSTDAQTHHNLVRKQVNARPCCRARVPSRAVAALSPDYPRFDQRSDLSDLHLRNIGICSKSRNCNRHVTAFLRPTLAGGGKWANLLDCAVEAAGQQCLSELQRRRMPERGTERRRSVSRSSIALLTTFLIFIIKTIQND